MDFPSNSHASTEKSTPTGPKKGKNRENRDIKKVVTGTVTQRKKPLGRRIKDIFVGGDFKNAILFVGRDVLLPSFKNMIVDAGQKGIERVVYGDVQPRRPLDPRAGRTTYHSSSMRGISTMLPDQPPVGMFRRQTVGDFIFQTKADAEAVLEGLNTIIDQYDVASISDLHEMMDRPSSFVENKWGWTNLSHVDIHQTREGWYIDLPSAEPIQ